MHTLTMKKRVLYITITLLVLAVMPAMSQNVKFDIYFDSLGIDTKEMRIGEQVKLTYELSVDSGYNVQIPSIGKGAAGGIEVLDSALSKSTTVDGRRIYKGEYVVTAFNEAPFVIAPIVARVDSDVYYTNTAHLIVNSVPIDTVNLKNIKGYRPVWDVSLTWNEYRDTVYLSFLIVLLLALLVWIVIRYINNKPIIRIVKIKPLKPSHFTALQKMDEIKNDAVLHNEENVKEYYTRLTDTLREYMCNRYKFNATDMTTPEIISNLLEFNDKEAIKELREILEVADLVKFAKLQPAINENDRNMLNAIEFVNATKDVEEENRKPVEHTEVNERSLNQKRLLIAAIFAVLCALIALTWLLITDLGHMLN